MQYRELGRTGLMVSEIGMGCEGFVAQEGALTEPLIDAMEQAGVNYIDLYTPDAGMRTRLGKALRGRREKFILQGHLCTIWKDGQYQRTRRIDEVKAGFEDLLARLETDSVEVGMIHYVDSLEDWEAVSQGPVLAYARELKAQGKIRHIGLSSHNPQAALAAVESGAIEVLMFSVNPCYDLQPAGEDIEALWADESYADHLVNMDPDREALYETCSRLGVGITVMKGYAGGRLFAESTSPFGVALTPVQCIHYVLTRPAVASILAGYDTPEHVMAAVAYETASEEERDYASILAGAPRHAYSGQCTYCGHCAPCPKGIDIAMVNKLYDLAVMQPQVPESIRAHYQALNAGAEDCIACGNCEKRCPFGVPVIHRMEKVKELHLL